MTIDTARKAVDGQLGSGVSMPTTQVVTTPNPVRNTTVPAE